MTTHGNIRFIFQSLSKSWSGKQVLNNRSYIDDSQFGSIVSKDWTLYFIDHQTEVGPCMDNYVAKCRMHVKSLDFKILWLL